MRISGRRLLERKQQRLKQRHNWYAKDRQGDGSERDENYKIKVKKHGG